MLFKPFKVGDEVRIKVLADNREWGYNPAPDGTLGKVVAFNEIEYGRGLGWEQKPGYYLNRTSLRILLETGEQINISDSHVELADQEEAKKRLEDFRAWHNTVTPEEKDRAYQESIQEDFVRDLPELPFYEGDKVEFQSRGYSGSGTVCRIHYRDIDKTRNDGSPYPIYEVTYERGGTSSFATNELCLVARGNIWKYYNNQPFVFADVKEMADFYVSIGESTECRNPRNGLYKWTLEEALDSIEAGEVHAFTNWSSVLNTSVLNVRRFNDAILGKVVATETLNGFGRTPKW